MAGRKRTRIQSERVIPMTVLQRLIAPPARELIVEEVNQLFRNVKRNIQPADITQQGYMLRLQVYADVDRETDE